ncbi:MAG TPA: hypothetical protein VFV61_05920, partial [Pyrinomonadaceae bacterium]|nr:hypothetical protein [Pyrinomonadaceae bacterium]
MTKQRIIHSDERTLRVFLLLGIIAILLAGLAGSSQVPTGRAQETRLRRSGQTTTARPTATPTPKSAPVTTRPTQTPAAQTPAPVATPPATVTQTPASQPTATPTPQVIQTGVDKIAPELGPPPPIPKLKPKPTPTPPEEFGEGEVVRVDTELVTLNVRVIDRNNRPIDNIQENEIHVYEDTV